MGIVVTIASRSGIATGRMAGRGIVAVQNGSRGVATGLNGSRGIIMTTPRQGVAGPAGGGLTWVDATTDTTMAGSYGYKADSISLLSFSLPVGAALGVPVAIRGYGLGGWQITQRAGEQIALAGNTVGDATTAGTGGRLFSVATNDGCDLVSLGGGLWQAITYGCDIQ